MNYRNERMPQLRTLLNEIYTDNFKIISYLVSISIIFYMTLDLNRNYYSYMKCDPPIYTWIMINLFLLVLLRIIVTSLECTNSNFLFTFFKYFLLLLYFPFFIIWNGIGLTWYNYALVKTPKCITYEF